MLKSIHIIHRSGLTLYEQQFEESIYEIKDLVTAFFSVLIVFTERSPHFGEIKELRCSSIKLLFDACKDDSYFVVLAVDQFDDVREFSSFLGEVREEFREIYTQRDFKGRRNTYDAFDVNLQGIIEGLLSPSVFQFGEKRGGIID